MQFVSANTITRSCGFLISEPAFVESAAGSIFKIIASVVTGIGLSRPLPRYAATAFTPPIEHHQPRKPVAWVQSQKLLPFFEPL